MSAPDPHAVMYVLRALKLGDLLVAVPALNGLRRGWPDHRIVLATPGWLAPIVALLDSVDELLPTAGLSRPLAMPTGEVDIAVNLHGRGPESSSLLAGLVPRRLLAHAPDTPDGPEWIEDQAERERWARLVRSAGAPADPDDLAIRVPDCEPSVAGAAVVHVGASYGSRLWPAERFARVANVLAAAGEHVVVTAGAEERDRALEVVVRAGLPESAVLAGRLDLTGLAALVAAARVLVSADTGAAHLASAYRVPSVVIFGPAPVEQWGPPADGPHVVLTDASLRRGDVFSDDPDPALLAVGSNDVLGAIEQLGFSLDRAAAN